MKGPVLERNPSGTQNEIKKENTSQTAGVLSPALRCSLIPDHPNLTSRQWPGSKSQTHIVLNNKNLTVSSTYTSTKQELEFTRPVPPLAPFWEWLQLETTSNEDCSE